MLLRGGEIILMFFLLQRSLTKTGKSRRKWENVISYVKDNWKKIPPDKNQKRFLHNFWNKYALIIVVIGGLDYLFFTWSLSYFNIAISSIIFELWLVIFVLLRYYTQAESEISGSIWALLLVALFGVIYINRSHISIDQSVNFSGIILIILAALLGGFRVERSLYWSEKMEGLSREKDFRIHEKGNKEKGNKIEWQINFVFIGTIIVNISTIFLMFIGQFFQIILGNNWNLSFASNQTWWFGNEVSWTICIMGGFASAIGMWSFRKGNLLESTLDINGIYYLTPVLSIVWLLPFGIVQLERWDYFIIGALIIIVVSILVSIESYTNRQGFRWLIISLWSIGLMVYFREEWINLPWFADGTPWEWSVESVDYYSLIVLSATIFILILSFRISRLIDRTSKEEDQYFRMKHNLDIMNHNFDKMNSDSVVLYKYLVSELKEAVREIDKSKAKNIAEIKYQFMNNFFKLSEHINTNEKLTKFLYDLKLDFELLCRSKQRGRYLAENLVLYIFSLVTIMVSIGTRPPVISNWNALIIDILAFLFASAICFMTINLIDLRLYRERGTEEHVEHEAGSIEKSDDDLNQTAVQVISIILAIVVSLSFIVLLYDKWMGIWFI